ncbi:MAG: hypothetical protein IPG99_22030 [Ignavibacteria bacterium]|nr:hypothetical protein [Ignavibacteria bacterium]
MKSHQKFTAIAVLFLLLLSSCSLRPDPEPLPFSVQTTLNLLQENSQFVMYLNFKSMRRTEFWKKNISDSILNAEKTFGSLLNTFKVSTGASISEGLDELYYSNSWFGENAIVLKGIFNRTTLDTLLARDSVFSITKSRDGTNIYVNNENGLYFFFKDNFTICASNYLKQIDEMIETSDTSKAGLLSNPKMLETIQSVVNKENLWMVTNEKMFIRGLFMNLLETTSGKHIEENDSAAVDTTVTDENLNVRNLYKAVNSLSFSAKMGTDLSLLVQGECISERTSKYLSEILSGLITVAKLSEKDKQDPETSQMLKNIELDRYDETVYVSVTIDEKNLAAFRSKNPMRTPPEM